MTEHAVPYKEVKLKSHDFFAEVVIMHILPKLFVDRMNNYTLIASALLFCFSDIIS